MTTQIKENEMIVVNDETVANAVKEFLSYKMIKEQAEAEMKKMEKIIIEAIKESGSNKICVHDNKCTLSLVKKTNISGSKLLDMFPDVFNQIATESVFNRLTIR